MNEIEEFSLIQDFISVFDPVVELRDGKPLSDSQRKLMERIARGDATDTDRDAALEILRKDAGALEFLAKQLQEN